MNIKHCAYLMCNVLFVHPCKSTMLKGLLQLILMYITFLCCLLAVPLFDTLLVQHEDEPMFVCL